MKNKSIQQKIKFNSNRYLLRGDLHVPGRHNERSILFIPGWSSTRTKSNEYATELKELGFVCMTYDMSGHGESTGDRTKISRKQFLDDAIAAYDFLIEQNSTGKRNIIVISSSFGCYLASILVSKRFVKQLVLRVPQNYPNKGFDRPKVNLHGAKLTDWRQKPRKHDATYSQQSLHNFQGEVLIIESEFDKYVTKQTIENYKNAVNDKGKLIYKYMQNTNHSLKTDAEKSGYVKILKEWLKK